VSDGEETPAPAPSVAGPQVPAGAKLCGNCKLWRAHSVDPVKGWVGNCRVQPNRGLFVPTAPICDVFAPRGEATVQRPEQPEVRRVREVPQVGPRLKRAGQSPEAAPTRVSAPVELDGDFSMTRDELMQVFLEASGMEEVPLAPRWEGGVVQMVPGKTDTQAKELPINALFHKVVMVRDRLRTLEQKLNAHPKLSDAEKVELQLYITRCYGSLTTFNVLFRDKDDHFVGAKGEGEG
jgi:hypothetical protein